MMKPQINSGQFLLRKLMNEISPRDRILVELVRELKSVCEKILDHVDGPRTKPEGFKLPQALPSPEEAPRVSSEPEVHI